MTHLPDEHNGNTADRDFSTHLLAWEADAVAPSVAFTRVCQAWLTVEAAQWAWLWTHNELLSRLAPDEQRAHLCLETPSWHEAATQAYSVTQTIAASALRGRQPVCLTAADKWHMPSDVAQIFPNGTEPAVVLGCQAIKCVPLLAPGHSDPIGVISLHYRDSSVCPRESIARLGYMALATAHFLHNLHIALQHRILIALNSLANEYLPQVARSSTDVRAKYLDELLALLRNELPLSDVSVFYRTPFEDDIQCIATTELSHADGHPISRSDLSSVRYRRHEGTVGGAFETGCISTAAAQDLADTLSRPPGGIRYSPHNHRYILVPIPRAHNMSQNCTAAGLLVCAEKKPSSTSSHSGLCTGFDFDTLQLVGNQVSCVLQTFEHRITRERTLSIVKHDLFAPLTMMRDIADQFLHGSFDADSAGLKNDMADMVLCSRFAANIIEQLDPCPDINALSLKRHSLGIDVIASIARLLGRYAERSRRMRVIMENMEVCPSLNFDREKVETVLFNVLLNAIKYGYEGTSIVISARLDVASVTINIINKGIGIDEGEESKIFMPYYRSQRARSVSPHGAGLGLTISKAIMEAHGGALRIGSLRDPTVFSLIFPRT